MKNKNIRDFLGDVFIVFGQVFWFIGDTLKNLILIALAIGCAATIDERSLPGGLGLLVLYKIHRIRRKKWRKLTGQTNKKPSSRQIIGPTQ